MFFVRDPADVDVADNNHIKASAPLLPAIYFTADSTNAQTLPDLDAQFNVE